MSKSKSQNESVNNTNNANDGGPLFAGETTNSETPGLTISTEQKTKPGGEFETEGEMEQTSLPFHNLEKDGPLTGVFLGLGPVMSTKNSDNENFNTYALVDITTKQVVLIPAYKVLEKVNDECEAGEYLVEITATGKKETQSGKDYNSFVVRKQKLKVPYKNFDIEKIRSMNR